MKYTRWSFFSGSSAGRIVLALSVIAALGLTGLSLFTFPLPTIIVLLLGTSILVLDRG